MTPKEPAAIPTLREALELISTRVFGGPKCADIAEKALAATPAPVPGPILSDRDLLVKRAHEAGFGTIGNFVMPPNHTGHITEELECFARAIEADIRAALDKTARELVASRALCDEHFNTILDLRAELAAVAGNSNSREFDGIKPSPVSAVPVAVDRNAVDAERWRFMMKAADNVDGPEASALDRLGNEEMEDHQLNSAQMADLADRAMADIAQEQAP